MESTPKTILIIEDTPDLAASLIDLVELSGHTSLHANTGRSGVQLALTEQPDLVLLDVRLPDITGYEVYERIRETDWGAQAKITIITASEAIETIAETIDVPLEHIIYKPGYSLQEMQAYINERLEN